MDREFLDAPVHVHMHVVTMYKWKTNYDDTHHTCTTKYSFTHVNFVQNVAHLRFFSSWACEFLNWKISAEAKDSLFGKFAPKEITHYRIYNCI